MKDTFIPQVFKHVNIIFDINNVRLYNNVNKLRTVFYALELDLNNDSNQPRTMYKVIITSVTDNILDFDGVNIIITDNNDNYNEILFSRNMGKIVNIIYLLGQIELNDIIYFFNRYDLSILKKIFETKNSEFAFRGKNKTYHLSGSIIKENYIKACISAYLLFDCFSRIFNKFILSLDYWNYRRRVNLNVLTDQIKAIIIIQRYWKFYKKRKIARFF